MRVRLAVDMSGTRNGVPWPSRGRIVELDDDEALSMLQSGMAEAVKAEDKEERAVLVPADMEDMTGRQSKPDRNETAGDDPKAPETEHAGAPVTTETASGLTRRKTPK